MPASPPCQPWKPCGLDRCADPRGLTARVPPARDLSSALDHLQCAAKATAAPGEIIHYELKGFSLVGIEVPLPEQSVDWELEAAPLPDDVRPPTGVRDDEPPGFVDFSGRFEASPIVQPGHYRSGLITATGWGELNVNVAFPDASVATFKNPNACSPPP